MPIPRELWYLPRPRRANKYKGGFPAHFERKLFALYDWPKKILQPFGGMAEFGLRVDVQAEPEPDIIADAHCLPFANNSFDFVLCDPPYSTELSQKLYGTGRIHWSKYTAEAVRVCKPAGYVALYHTYLNPRPRGTSFDRIIVVITRVNHVARICCVFRKEPSAQDS